MTENLVLFERSTCEDGSDDSSTNDVWDDTKLIEAYDKAINLAKDQVASKITNKVEAIDLNVPKKTKKKDKMWNLGDKCRSVYGLDNQTYEADIIDIMPQQGMCLVRYVGYGNEEEVPLHTLTASGGEVARSLQTHEAHISQNDTSNMDIDSHCQRTAEKQPKRSSGHKNKARNSNCNVNNGMPLPSSSGISIPPPPPPHVFNCPSSESEAMSAMLMSWYMSGYHTGYYQGLKHSKNNS